MENYNINQIITDWFFKLDKGYSEFPYPEEDLNVLKEVMISQGKNYEDYMKVRESLTGKKQIILEKPDPDKNKKISEMITVLGESGLMGSVLKKIESALRSSPNFDSIYSNFRTMTLSKYIGGGWKIYEEFFDIVSDELGFGRGEAMSIMAIKGSSSGGKAEKDLKIGGKIWEVKELTPDQSFRPGKSGDSGKVGYVRELRKFYDLLEDIELNNPAKDKVLLSNLNSLFRDSDLSSQVFDVLLNNFRGDNQLSKDGSNFFQKSYTSREMGKELLESQYNGLKFLRKIRKKIIESRDVANTVRMTLKSSNSENSYYISPEDADKINQAEPNSKITIRKGENESKKDLRSFIIKFLKILNHSLVKDPKILPDSLSKVKEDFFSEIEAVVYHKNRDPKPSLGTIKDFRISNISGGMAVFVLSSKVQGSIYSFINDQE